MFYKLSKASPVIGKRHPVVLFVILPLLMNGVLLGLYFSGVQWMQNLIVPDIAGLKSINQPREFGLLETVQNFLLLGVIVLLAYALLTKNGGINRAFYGVGLAVFVFLFLEEIDYGLHYFEILTGQSSTPLEQRNWHNQRGADGVENTARLKKLNDMVNLFWFFLLPCLALSSKIKSFVKRILIVPHAWFALTVLVAVCCSQLAHYLNDGGYDIIAGQVGPLDGNISEFRETTIYYIYFVYARQLVQLDRIINWWRETAD